MWNYYRVEPINSLFTNSESFKYKTSITRNTYNVGDDENDYDANKVGKNETEIVILLKHLSNFWRPLNSIATLLSQAPIDMKISHKKFVTISKEKKYEKLKENVRNKSEKLEEKQENMKVDSIDLKKVI